MNKIAPKFDTPLSLLLGLFVMVSFSYSNNTGVPFLPIRLLLLSGGLLIHLGLVYFYNKEKFIEDSRFAKMTTWAFSLFGLYMFCNAIFMGSLKAGVLILVKYGLFITLIYLLTQYLYRKDNLIHFFRLITLLVGIHAFIGLGMIGFGWFQETWGANYVGGMMGHRNLWGSYLAASIFFPVWMLIYTKGVWRILGLISFCFAIPAVILSYSRSAWIALVFGFLVWLLITFFDKRPKGLPKRISMSLFLSIFLIGVATYFLASENSKEVIKDRLNTIITANISGDESKESTGSVVFRIKTWKQSIEIAKEQPIFGIGLGNWKKKIPKFGVGSYMESSGMIMRASPHNEFISIASETGLIGIFLFLMTIGFTIILGIKGNKELSNSTTMSIACMACLSAILIDMLFSFPMGRVEHFMLTGLAIAGLFSQNKSETDLKEISNTPVITILITLLILITLIISFEFFRFEKEFATVKDEFYSGNYEAVIEKANDAKSIIFEMSREGDPVEMFSGMAYQMLNKKEIAKLELEKALVIHPHNARIFNALGTLFFSEKKYLEAISVLEEGRRYMPHYEILKKNLALSYFGAGQFQNCIDICQTMYIHDDKKLYDIYFKSFEMRERSKNEAAKRIEANQ